MDRNGIDRAAVLSLRGVLLDWREGNEETLAAAGRHPDRLIPVATHQPVHGRQRRRAATARRTRASAACGCTRLFHNYPLDSAFTDDICRGRGRAAASR